MQPWQAHSEKWGSTEQQSSDLSFVQGLCHKGHVREEVSVGSHLGAHGTMRGEGDMAHTLCPTIKHAGVTLSERWRECFPLARLCPLAPLSPTGLWYLLGCAGLWVCWGHMSRLTPVFL